MNNLTKQEYSKIIDLSSDVDKTTTRRYTLKIDFSALSNDQIAEWAVKPIVINWQNTNRKKEIKDWSPAGNIIIKAVPCGTKTVGITPEQALLAIVGNEIAEKLTEKFGSGALALAYVKETLGDMFKEPVVEPEVEPETEETEETL